MTQKINMDYIKNRLDRATVAELLSFLGYEINRAYKFKLRPDERTPSASISRTGRITDFGTGWSGDIIDVLQDYHSKGFKEAAGWLSGCLGVDA
jgi:DNA primase